MTFSFHVKIENGDWEATNDIAEDQVSGLESIQCISGLLLDIIPVMNSRIHLE